MKKSKKYMININNSRKNKFRGLPLKERKIKNQKTQPKNNNLENNLKKYLMTK